MLLVLCADYSLWLGSEECHGQQVSLGGESGRVWSRPRLDANGEPSQQSLEKPTCKIAVRTHSILFSQSSDCRTALQHIFKFIDLICGWSRPPFVFDSQWESKVTQTFPALLPRCSFTLTVTSMHVWGLSRVWTKSATVTSADLSTSLNELCSIHTSFYRSAFCPTCAHICTQERIFESDVAWGYLADDLLHILSYSQSCLCTSYWSRPQLLRVFRPLRTPFLRHCFSFYVISDLITVCSCWCLALLLLFLSPPPAFDVCTPANLNDRGSLVS